jgi:AraC-like DNA-binding protein
MIHAPHLPFSEYSNSTGTHQWFAFDAQVWPQLDVLHQIPIAAVVRLRSPEIYSTQFRRLLVVWESPVSPTRNLRLMALTMELIGILIDDWQAAGAAPRPVASSHQSERFSVVVNYMQANLEHKISRDDLARLVHLHPGYFDRAFRLRYGVAPMQMLRDLRLRHAQHLLESTEDVLETVARRSGLGDATHLSRIFRERLGQTPTEYRAGAKRARESYLQPMQSAL